MIKNSSKKNKCADIEFQDEYSSLVSGVTNPYCYNFGKIEKNGSRMDFVKLQNKVNAEFFYKK